MQPAPDVLQFPRQRDTPPGPVVAAVPQAQGAHSRRHRATAVLLVDLLGIGLLVSTPGASTEFRVGLAVIWVLVLVVRGVSRRSRRPERACSRPVLLAGGCLLTTAAAVSYGFGDPTSRGVLCVLLAAVLSSAGARMFLRRRVPERVLLIGTPKAAALVRALVSLRTQQDVRIVGVCCPVLVDAPSLIGGVPVVGALDAVGSYARAGGVDAVLVCAEPETAGPVLRKIVWDLEGSGVPVLVAPGIVELGPARLRLNSVAGLPVLGITDAVRGGLAWFTKRVVDRTSAAVGLLLLLPVFVVIAAAVRLSSPGAALFRQERVGQDGRTFTLLKFRTMHVDAEERLDRLRAHNEHEYGPLFKIEEDPRVTPVGRVLRRGSLDELPQLWNVLCGDMSLVGPRPPLPHEVVTYCDAVPRRLLVPPGLSGLWQVSGRADLDWDESARLDLWYVENWSLALDLSILRRTVGAVLRGRGAY